MDSLNRCEKFKNKQLQEQARIIDEERNGVGNKDIHNLEWLLYSINPYSFLGRRGCIRSLRKAIKALKISEEKQKK